MPDAAFAAPDLTAFAGLDDLGLEVTGQLVEPGRAVLACRVVESDHWWGRCGCQGVARDTVIRRLAHAPMGWRPTTLEVKVRRYRCAGCGHVWCQSTQAAAQPRAKVFRAGLRRALAGLVVQHLSMARVARGLGVSWSTANEAVLAEAHRVLINEPSRFEGVSVIGVDDSPCALRSQAGGAPLVWRHARKGRRGTSPSVIDLTPVRAGTGPARLPGMVPGRSKQVFKTWLAERPQAWRQGIEVLARDGLTGYQDRHHRGDAPGDRCAGRLPRGAPGR